MGLGSDCISGLGGSDSVIGPGSDSAIGPGSDFVPGSGGSDPVIGPGSGSISGSGGSDSVVSPSPGLGFGLVLAPAPVLNLVFVIDFAGLDSLSLTFWPGLFGSGSVSGLSGPNTRILAPSRPAVTIDLDSLALNSRLWLFDLDSLSLALWP